MSINEDRSSIARPPFWRYAGVVVPIHFLVSSLLFLIELPAAKQGDGNPVVVAAVKVLCWPFYLLARFQIETVLDLPDYIFMAIYLLGWIAGGFFWAWVTWIVIKRRV